MRRTRKTRYNKPLSITRHLLLPSSRFLLTFTCCLGLGLSANHVIAAIPKPTPITETILSPGMKGAEVQVLQIQLKALGYYQGLIDGDYGENTQNAVAKFQQAKALEREDGIADMTTQSFITEHISGKTEVKTYPIPTPKTTININTDSQPQTEKKQINFIWWSLLGLGILATTGGTIFLVKKFNKVANSSTIVTPKLLSPSPDNQERLLLASANINSQPTTDLLQLQTKPLVSQLNVCEELMQELQSNNSKKRRKAIWKLGQDGDSRAIKPLVDLMVDADSEQQGLILSTLAEIGTRTINPMNRALAISIRDDNPQVRKNAIRDLVRMYDVMGKMSKIVLYAMEDPDPEVQETAKYALNQINRVRTIPEQQILTDMSTEES
ncbi:peptidoglycan-binding protein [Okeanomitos corallinicola TIOX110]|uniref:Peptidoglycan-binding protein n=1 Tax=Okeanomitos corallinicola TIOX110 TaxID=3133117 RepID=A0ABZ2UU74_9CYAN